MSEDLKPARGLRSAGALFTTAAVVGASLLMVAPAAHAAEDVITVTTATGCDEPGTLGAAIADANASTNPDGVRIVFDESLAGTGGIVFPGSTCRMSTDLIGVGNQIAGVLGARYVIDSEVPVTIDFTNLDEISTTTDADIAGIYVRSNDVVLENLANLKAGAAGLAIDGTNVTVSNFVFEDSTSPIAENGVALLDGATNVTIQNSTFWSQWWSSILIDGSVAQPTTVTNIVIDNIESRGVESNFGHIDIEDGAVVNGLTVTNSTFGATDESSSSHAVYINPAVTASNLTFSGNTVLRGVGAEMNGFYFEGATGNTSSFTDTVIDGNVFQGISTVSPLSRIIGDNSAIWNGLEYTNNQAEFTRGIRMSGTVTDALFDGNTFSYMREPSDAGVTLGRELSNVTVSNNLFDTVWAHDAVSVEGTSAENVVIEDNVFQDFYADVSRSAVGIDVVGVDNVVQNNQMITDLSRAGVDLPANIDNHWAVYFRANAADAATSVGWSILNNHIDGYGGEDRSQAPIVHNGIGKLLVTGNTFGENTRGSVDVETEEGEFWFLWNVWNNSSNNTVQTYRAENVRYDGSTARFTAVKPENEAGNNDATAPVTLHVYWTAADNAEEYLGSIEDVTPGQRLAIDTTRTDGFIRVQTVDANGYTSQYSSIDPDTAVAPAAPVVTEVTEDAVTGTGQPEATVSVRDSEGNEVQTGTVDEDGNWTIDTTNLACGTTYTVVQVVDGEESEPTEFTTVDCPAGGSDADTDAGGSSDGAADGGSNAGGAADGGANAAGAADGGSNAAGAADGGSATAAADGSTGAKLSNTGGVELIGAALGAVVLMALAGLLFAARRRQA